MWQVEDKFRVIIGGNTYINVPNIVVYKETPLFTMKRSESDGSLEIDLEIFDEKGARIATVRRGMIVQGNQDAYEIKEEADRYSVMEKATGQVICDIRKRAQAENTELEVSVKLYTPDGFLFEATPEHTNLAQSILLSGNVFQNMSTGILIA